MTVIDLCALDELEDPGTRGFALPEEAGERDAESLFVVRRDGEVRAYVNRCPHIGAPLEWQPHQFLDLDGCYIQCAMHGALFRTEDGFCVSGPCAGERLAPLEVEVHEGRVILLLPGAQAETGAPQ
jgi:nitrite reductase/ring-hydroxylating ferredoxin subunit